MKTKQPRPKKKGRPKKPDDQKYNCKIQILLDSEMLDLMDKLAKLYKTNRSEYIRMMVLEQAKKNELI